MHEKEKVKDFRKVRKPKGLTVEENDNEIKLILDGKKVEEENMQVTCNAFEGWAVAAQACILNEESNKKVVLDVKPGVHYDQDPEKTKNEGHLARFLYRVMRFDEQYDWFILSEELSNEVKDFRRFLESGVFINNIATCDAGNTNWKEDENALEDILAKGNTLKNVLTDVVDVGNNDVFRQLPVGLFKTDKTGFHPLVNEKGLEILSNGSNPKIKYYMAKYGFKGEVYRVC